MFPLQNDYNKSYNLLLLLFIKRSINCIYISASNSTPSPNTTYTHTSTSTKTSTPHL